LRTHRDEVIKTNPPISFSSTELQQAGLAVEDVRPYFPSYILNSAEFPCSFLQLASYRFARFLMAPLVGALLSPRHGEVGKLDVSEVEAVYDREADSYDAKHHLTTHGMDTVWRRWSGYAAVTLGRPQRRRLKVLDLCTGTGLAVKEMAHLLAHWSVEADIIGLDYNEKMLANARKKNLEQPGVHVSFVRGDAMNLTEDHPAGANLVRLPLGEMDLVTQMFGIGGICSPLLVFREVLKVLKPGGQYFLIDMHQPIPDQPGEWPLLFQWIKFPWFETLAYNDFTIPVVLKRLWGWRDTTSDFYLLPLVTWVDPAGDCWGYHVINLETESQRWWFSLPLMPTAKIIVQKTSLSREEHEKRQKILSLLKIGP
jgi:ubiquinone/menaquinone biosynthesis C-methylase UbiE